MSTTTAAQPARREIAWASILYMAALHIGALLAFVPAYFSWSGVLLCVCLHWLTGGIGICMTYHRLLTHRSFTVRPRWLEYPLTAIGAMASEGGAIGWVADHRRHHAYSDDDLDTHSPLRGFMWAHMGWFMVVDAGSRHDEAYYKRWAPDLYRDPIHRWLDRYFIIFPLASFAVVYAAGTYYGLGMSWLIWAGFVRTIFVLHTTWLVNSASHIWGYRTHATRDQSTNLWWVAALTYGEGWHNNHHAFQTSARHGLDWWEVDPTYIAIKLMSFLGLAGDLKLAKVRKDADGSVVEPGPRTFIPAADAIHEPKPEMQESSV